MFVLCVILWSCNGYSAFHWHHHKFPLYHVHRPVYLIEWHNFAVRFAKIQYSYKISALCFLEVSSINKVVYKCQYWRLCILGPYRSECLHTVKILMGITDNYGQERSWSIAVAKYKNSLFQQYTDLCFSGNFLFHQYAGQWVFK